MKRAIACLLLAGALAWTQEIAVGKILVASRKSHDADFAGTVILLVRHNQQATVGLFLNRPLNVPLSEVYPDLKGAQLKLYAGGPLTVGIRALYRSRAKPAEAAHILDDVFMISTKTLLGKMAAAETPPSVFRVYAGYTGWAAGQLNDEVGRGLWHIFAGDAGVVFDPHPETVWSRLIGRLPRADNHFRMRNMFEKSSVQARKPV
ncbi:MAG TPA: YqgE/AlgH family protein [Bryobacteraceae bacterium]|jgi:putative transcriptional regulator|nr:YqgE/AlgH family protein [Bryobacteraceae bacterium]